MVPSKSNDDNLTPVRSVARAADLLLQLGHRPKRLADLSAETQLSKGTVHRLLATLRLKGLVVQDNASGLYSLGPACFRLMLDMVDGVAVFALDAEGVLERLRTETLETVAIHIRVGAARLCLEELESPQAIRYTSGIRQFAPIQVGSAGKTLMAFLPNDERERLVLSVNQDAIGGFPSVNLDELRHNLEMIAEAGFAVSEGERVTGASAVSAPVLDASGRVVAAISVLGPSTRFAPERLEGLVELVRSAASEISKRVHASPERFL